MNSPTVGTRVNARAGRIPSGPAMLNGELSVPPGATGLVLLAHGSGSSRHSMNEAADAQLRCVKQRVIVPGATHLFEEPGAIEEVARLAAGWFQQHLQPD